jgi:16S rRNA (cytosine1407-C5)-methyltransferase
LSDNNVNLESLPSRFLERLELIIPSDKIDEVKKSFIEKPVTTFRVNILCTSVDRVLNDLKHSDIEIHNVPWMEQAFWVAPDDRDKLMDTEVYRKSEIYLQNLSSMIPPLLLDPRPGEKILDLAAAPGSKTLQMACMMQNEGEITAIELVRKRYYKMLDNVKQQGAKNIRIYNMNGESIWKRFAGQYDKVLIDAPCSTEARFRVDEKETYRYWSMQKIKEMVRKQSRLLYSAIQSLRVGGTLVYSTCSFSPEENEGVINRVLQKFGSSIELEPLSLPISNIQNGLGSWKKKNFHPSLVNCQRILPDYMMEGFFVCKLIKRDITR